MSSQSRLLLLALLFAFSTLTACGGAPEASSTTPSSAEANPPVLFRVEGGSGPSYLLGTIHVHVSLDEALPAPWRDELTNARVVVLEADARDLTSQPQIITRYAVSPSSEPALSTLLTPTQWERVVAELAPQGMNATTLDIFRPWLPTVMLMVSRANSLSEGPQPQGMDALILDEASARGQALRFLETAESQIALIANIDSRIMLSWLAELIDEPEQSVEELRALVRAYRQGDLAAIEQQNAKTAAEHPQYIEAMFGKRNRAWVPALAEELSRGGAFVAVGAGHLVGPEGVIALLEAEGLRVERVGGER